MATRLTRNLKLRVSDELTSDAIYNLERIDTLGATFLIDTLDNTNLVSEGDLILTPDGSVEIRADLNVVGDVTVENIRLFDSDKSNYVELVAPSSLSTNVSLQLPDSVGTAGYLLKTDGSGNLDWISPESVAGGGQSLVVNWIEADGASKIITHNFGTTQIEVMIYDTTNLNFTNVNSVTYTDSNTITLAGVDQPPPGGYKVYLRESI